MEAMVLFKKSILILFITFLIVGRGCNKNIVDKSPGYEIGSYYFPNYHPNDSRNKAHHGPGWSEWELVKNAKPRFPGHQQPKIPLWGYVDEADPKVMEMKIDAAADHGIDYFIFDWYYYDDGPFLQRCLEEGYLKASNNDRVKFCLMWANHNWLDIHPVRKEARRKGPKILYPGKIKIETWDKMTDYIIETYFKHPSYCKIDGEPYFSVYDLTRFMQIFGSVEATAKGIVEFRRKVKEAGFLDLNMNAVVWRRTILPTDEKVTNISELVKKLGFDSITSYVWVHHVRMPKFPQTPYTYVQEKYFEYAKATADTFGLPYYPNVTMGWDSSPRAHQDDPYENIGYPFMATLSGNTPVAFKNALIQMKILLDEHPECNRIFNINCWNEWTEGSYLEPDTIHKMAYLEAIRDVFGN